MKLAPYQLSYNPPRRPQYMSDDNRRRFQDKPEQFEEEDLQEGVEVIDALLDRFDHRRAR